MLEAGEFAFVKIGVYPGRWVVNCQTFSVPGGIVEIGGDYYHNSGFHYLAQEDSFTEEGSYRLLSLRASYLHETSNVRVTLFGTNVTDTRYNYSRFTLDFGTTDAAAPPAFYGIRLNWDY